MTTLKALYCKTFTLLIVHAPPCAAVRTRPSADGEQRWRSRGNISPGWNLDGTAPRTGSSVYFCSYRAELFPILCPTAGLRLESICRPATGKYSGRRRRTPSHRPTAGNFHHRCCSIDAPALERAEIGGNRNEVSCSASNHPLLIWTQKGRPASKHRPPHSLGTFHILLR